MSRSIDGVTASVADMIASGSDITIKQAFGCRRCGNTKQNSHGGDYCNHCGRDSKKARIIIVSTKKTFFVE